MSEQNFMKGVEEPDSKDFYTYLKESQQTDLTDIERTGCITTGRDLKRNPVIVLIPTLGMSTAEKIEVSFRKMLLLFIRKANDIIGSNYSVVYAHTNIDIINQYPLIYKFYSVLPRAYKKNLTKMYVIHPNIGLKMFFEFARVFLSHKFYSKLVLLDNILDFQKLIPPTQLVLPLKFLRKEDEMKGYKYYSKMASLKDTFDPSIGTTRLMHICTTFIKLHGGLLQKGLFRLAGDAGEINLAKVRLQYAFQFDDYTDRIILSENQDYILIGDITSLQTTRPLTLDRKTSGDKHLKYKPNNTSNHNIEHSSTIGNIPNTTEEVLPDEQPMSIIVLHDINTIAQIFKLSIGSLPEALVSYTIYHSMIEATRRHEATGYGREWELSIAELLSQLPHEHLSTLVYVIQFLREVSSNAAANSMDSQNLAIVFTPTIFQPDMVDPMKAVMELKFSKIILKELIDRLNILQLAMHLYTDKRTQAGAEPLLFIFENPIKASYETVLNEELGNKLNISDIRNITDNFSSRLVNRMNLTPRGKHNNNNMNNNEKDNSNNNEEDNNSEKERISEMDVNIPILPPTPPARPATLGRENTTDIIANNKLEKKELK